MKIDLTYDEVKDEYTARLVLDARNWVYTTAKDPVDACKGVIEWAEKRAYTFMYNRTETPCPT